MLPLVGIPSTIQNAVDAYRQFFCREAGFGHTSRYISGLLLSPNKTLQGICSQWVWPEGEAVSRRAMHASVFESGWRIDALMRIRIGSMGWRWTCNSPTMKKKCWPIWR